MRGKAVLVTGGAHGIGAAVARELSVLDARVAVVDRDPAAAPGRRSAVTWRPRPGGRGVQQ
ncbi:SDR family NAD(P)-dependent oxidoreductase [Mycobacterium sp. 1274756.6]|uniref:SDR family NAD(P)-dependent oxidoreductase n=1 Tax=Mycobacterium sp. 1274756.6 TaxID=1834076 RepID=UPI0009EDCCA0|nr:SDR family NAD(P)-dependent oxidoreductase [Mycobacterium sp. 1274756.6]